MTTVCTIFYLINSIIINNFLAVRNVFKECDCIKSGKFKAHQRCDVPWPVPVTRIRFPSKLMFMADALV